jgi:hypothetical protein
MIMVMTIIRCKQISPVSPDRLSSLFLARFSACSSGDIQGDIRFSSKGMPGLSLVI